jgi:hypothetical protein
MINNRITTFLLPALLLAGCARLPPAGALDGGAASQEVPARFWGTHVFVPMHATEVDTAWGLLDTGANMSIVALSTARAFGLSVTGRTELEGYGQDTLRGGVTEISIQVPGSVPYRLYRPVVDLSGLEPFLGKPFDGILGADFFTRFVVEIDYAGKRVILHDPRRFRPRPGDTRIALEFVVHRPHIQATIVPSGTRELDGQFVIDTGAGTAISLYAPFVRQHEILDALPQTVGRRSSGIGGRSEDLAGRLRRLNIGPFAIGEPVATLSLAEAGLAASDGISGHIGGGVLNRFTVTFDYRRKAMYLRPGARFDEPFEADMAGFTFLAVGVDFRQYRVEWVEPGSPAERAGLIEGDLIREADGRPASEFTMPELQFLKRGGPDSVLELVVRRGEEDVPVRIRLERRL